MPDCAGRITPHVETEHRIAIGRAFSSAVAEVRAFWRAKVGVGPSPIGDIFEALARRFVGSIVLANSGSLTALRGRGVIFLANHQTMVESLNFAYLMSGLLRAPVQTLATADQAQSWLGALERHALAYPGVASLEPMLLVDRSDPKAMMAVLTTVMPTLVEGPASLLVHVEGTRALSADHRVAQIADGILDVARGARVPVVPVRFCRGLPVRPAAERLDLPIGLGRQDIWIGRPIRPDALMELTNREQEELLLSALNTLGPEHDKPAPPDLLFATKMAAWAAQTGATRVHAALLLALAELPEPAPLTRKLLDGARQRHLELGAGSVDAWLASLAHGLFGPSGPEVVVRP